MKTKIEINGYEITIEEVDGQISVKAERDEETVEEFTLEPVEEGQGEESQEESDSDDIKSFDDFGGEGAQEEDFPGEDEGGQEEGQEEGQDDEDEESNESAQLESFQSFINKKK